MKITFGGKSYKTSIHVRVNFGDKSILLKITQTDENQFHVSRIIFGSLKCETKHGLSVLSLNLFLKVRKGSYNDQTSHINIHKK